MSQGRASGTVSYRGNAVTANIDVTGLAFSDKSGLHAGEKIAATLNAEALQEKFHFHSIGGNDGVVIWRKRLFDDRRHMIKPDCAGIPSHLFALLAKTLPIAPFVSNPPHSRMIISEAEHAKKVRTGDNHPSAHTSHTHKFPQEFFRLLDVLQHV